MSQHNNSKIKKKQYCTNNQLYIIFLVSAKYSNNISVPSSPICQKMAIVQELFQQNGQDVINLSSLIQIVSQIFLFTQYGYV